MIGVFYRYGRNSFEASENIWEGVLGLIAAVIITAMGAVLLRVSKTPRQVAGEACPGA